MTDADRNDIAKVIEPQRVYDLFELQDLGIPPADVLQAAGEAHLARWLVGNKPWERPDSDARLQSDTTGHRMPRLVPSIKNSNRDRPDSDRRATIGAPEPPE